MQPLADGCAQIKGARKLQAVEGYDYVQTAGWIAAVDNKQSTTANTSTQLLTHAHGVLVYADHKQQKAVKFNASRRSGSTAMSLL